ncbi:hypothetical protein [uncultured Kushneria sp.]|uniref:hypothetical protein n=1 Tax=uncultured Kushneria sp. TaxID=905033 RepID=UPI00260FD693|nr:hypothetical protein [uncultured Kushneria sp.]
MAGMQALTRTVAMTDTGEIRTFPWLVPPAYEDDDIRRSVRDMPLQQTLKVTANISGQTIWQLDSETEQGVEA